MTRAAMAGDIAGSRFERSIWQGETFRSATCVGYDQTDVLHDASGESASAFPLFQPACHVTDDSILTVAVMKLLAIRTAFLNQFQRMTDRCNFGFMS